ncbi:MAG: NADH-quinone oxidoreductase subunit M [Capsulimonadaceae bacterium]|nr:NADH-quinone oxidoreductase subunit M [Capsulimonadaceae bacterium]
MSEHLLSIVTWLPLLGGFILLALPYESKLLHARFALGVTLLTLLVSIPLLTGFHAAIPSPSSASSGQFSFIETLTGWGIPQLGVNYILGVDGISLLMVLMTTAIFPFVVGASFKGIKDRTKMFFFLILLVETAILGVFDSLNLVLFYIFYEAMLIPLYFLVGVWGGPKRIQATMKFFLYTMVGSMLMLVSILYTYVLVHTFDFVQVQQLLPQAFDAMANHTGVAHAHLVEVLLFLGFFAAFAVKSPVWPLHSWVPDAYAEAPTGVTIVLVALKMGLYGFIRFNVSLFPTATAELAPIAVVLGVIGVIYAALVAAAQTDLKRLAAYSSISHIGVIVVAIFALTAAGWTGAVIQMVSHTFTMGALFILIGYLYERRGTYDISSYGGVWKVMPYFSVVFLIATLSAIALPGTAGFYGEFLMLVGSFQTYPWAAAIATTAAIWSAVYMLWMFKRVMHGKINKPEVEAFTDLSVTEKWALVPLVAIILWIGIYPIPLVHVLNGPAELAASTVVPARTVPNASTGTVLAILGRTFIPDRRDSRDLTYLPYDKYFAFTNAVTGSKTPGE